MTLLLQRDREHQFVPHGGRDIREERRLRLPSEGATPVHAAVFGDVEVAPGEPAAASPPVLHARERDRRDDGHSAQTECVRTGFQVMPPSLVRMRYASGAVGCSATR